MGTSFLAWAQARSHSGVTTGCVGGGGQRERAWRRVGELTIESWIAFWYSGPGAPFGLALVALLVATKWVVSI